MTHAYLLLGANLGERSAALAAATQRLRESGQVFVTSESAIYESPAEDMPPETPDFLNQVIEITTALSANELLDLCEDIEREFGRTHKRQMRSRTLDIDILLFGDKVIDSTRLKIPHARLTERGFALIPLIELRPEITDPRTGRRLAEYVTSQMRDTVREKTLEKAPHV